MKYATAFFSLQFFMILVYIWGAFLSNYDAKRITTAVPLVAESVKYMLNINGEETVIDGSRLEKHGNLIKFYQMSGIHKARNSKTFTFSGDEGGTTGNRNFYLKGNGVMVEDRNRISGNDLYYDAVNGNFLSRSAVTIISKNSKIEGTDLVYNMTTKNATLKNVKGTIWIGKGGLN